MRLHLLLLFLVLSFPFISANTYFYVGENPIAVNSDSGIDYLRYDRLGTEINTDTLPFGQIISEGERFGFTKKEQDISNLHYFAARYYDSAEGNFISSDLISSEPSYQYVNNNPMNKIDPTGLTGELVFMIPGSERMIENRIAADILLNAPKPKMFTVTAEATGNHHPIKLLLHIMNGAAEKTKFLDEYPSKVNIIHLDVEFEDSRVGGKYESDGTVLIKKGRVQTNTFHELRHGMQDELGMVLGDDIYFEMDAEAYNGNVKKAIGLPLNPREEAAMAGNVKVFKSFYNRAWGSIKTNMEAFSRTKLFRGGTSALGAAGGAIGPAFAYEDPMAYYAQRNEFLQKTGRFGIFGPIIRLGYGLISLDEEAAAANSPYNPANQYDVFGNYVGGT